MGRIKYGYAIVLFLAIVGLALYGFGNVEQSCSAEELRSMEDHLRKAVVTCYALEGRYPPSVEYLQENYGLQWNDKKFVIHYEAFAENIMPEISVVGG